MASSTNATAKSPFIWTCVYEGTVDEIGLCLAVARDGSKPYGFMPKNRACSLDFPRVRVTYRLLLRLLQRKVYLFGRVFMRVRLRDLTLSVVVRNGSKSYGFMHVCYSEKSISLDVCLREYGEKIGLCLAVSRDIRSICICYYCIFFIAKKYIKMLKL